MPCDCIEFYGSFYVRRYGTSPGEYDCYCGICGAHWQEED